MADINVGNHHISIGKNTPTDDDKSVIHNFIKKEQKIVDDDVGKGLNTNQIFEDVQKKTHMNDPNKYTPAQRDKINTYLLNKNSSNIQNQGQQGPQANLAGNSPMNSTAKKNTHYSAKEQAIAKKYKMDPAYIMNTDGDGMAELKSMIGLNSVKDQMKRYIIDAMIDKRAQKLGQKSTMKSLNMIFMGSPGTGKTVVARLVGKILFQNGIIPKPLFKECSSKDLISPLVGGSAINTNKVVSKAIGGVLFIDEAYNLAPSKDPSDHSNTSKDSAVSELLRCAENHRNNLVIIMAGYEDKMKDLMKRGNPGLKSRFNHKILFPDYTDDEMCQIFDFHATKDHCVCSKQVAQDIHKKIPEFNSYAKHQGDNSNGRLMRNLLQCLIECRNYRNGSDIKKIPHLSLHQIDTITDDDVDKGFEDAHNQEDNS